MSARGWPGWRSSTYCVSFQTPIRSRCISRWRASSSRVSWSSGLLASLLAARCVCASAGAWPSSAGAALGAIPPRGRSPPDVAGDAAAFRTPLRRLEDQEEHHGHDGSSSRLPRRSRARDPSPAREPAARAGFGPRRERVSRLERACRIQLERVALVRELLGRALHGGVLELAELASSAATAAVEIAQLERRALAASRPGRRPLRACAPTARAARRSRGRWPRRRARAASRPRMPGISPPSRAAGPAASRTPARARGARTRASSGSSGRASAWRGSAARARPGRGRRVACRRARSVTKKPPAARARIGAEPDEPVHAAQRRLEAHELAVRVLEVREHLRRWS